jgi:hypothetical protein
VREGVDVTRSQLEQLTQITVDLDPEAEAEGHLMTFQRSDPQWKEFTTELVV